MAAEGGLDAVFLGQARRRIEENRWEMTVLRARFTDVQARLAALRRRPSLVVGSAEARAHRAGMLLLSKHPQHC
jgi:hypothetical protein